MNSWDAEALCTSEALACLRQHRGEKPENFVLRFARDSQADQGDIPIAGIAEQLACENLLRRKIPDWLDADCLVLREALEQASSQWTANYKRQLLGPVDNGLDCTAGIGVDCLHCAAENGQWLACERDPQRARLLRWNAARLRCEVDVHVTDSMAFLHSQDQQFDALLIDPARRDTASRQLDPRNCLPNVVEELEVLCQRASRVLIKLAPASQRQLLCELFPAAQSIHYLSSRGEAKECLVLLHGQHSEATQIHVTDVGPGPAWHKHWRIQELDDSQALHRSSALSWVGSHDPALLCAGAEEQLCRENHAAVLGDQRPLWTADEPCPDIPGRRWKVQAQLQAHPKKFRRFCQDHGVKAAVVIARGNGLQAEEIRQQCRLRHSEHWALICYREQAQTCHAVLATKA